MLFFLVHFVGATIEHHLSPNAHTQPSHATRREHAMVKVGTNGVLARARSQRRHAAVAYVEGGGYLLKGGIGV